MYGMDEPEVARRVGVPVEFVEHLVKLGILQPDDQGSFSQGDLFRVPLLRSPDKAGVPLDRNPSHTRRLNVLARTFSADHLLRSGTRAGLAQTWPA